MKFFSFKNNQENTLLVSIFLMGFTTLLFEILLTRIFSVTMWYHFAFVAISLALFGIAVSGVVTRVFHRFFQGEKALLHMACSCLFLGIAIPLGFSIDLKIPFLPFDASQARTDVHILKPYLLFSLKFLALGLPFFLAGLTVILAFIHFPQKTTRIYFADLVGGGIGCAFAVPLLHIFSAPTAILFLAVFPLFAAILLFRYLAHFKLCWISVIAILLALGLVGFNESKTWIQIDKVKSYDPRLTQEPEKPKVFEAWNAISRVAVHPLNVSYSPALWFYGKKPTRYPLVLEVTNDAGARTFIFPKLPSSDYAIIFRNDVSDAVFAVKTNPEVLVIGVGGGKDILSALHLGAKKVTGVELNPLMIDVVQKEFGKFSGRPYDDPRVQIVIDEGRNYIASHKKKYDVIKISVTDTWAASAMGAYALSENYLYTVEAMKDYLNHLKPGGYLSITRWYPQESLRLLSLTQHAFNEMGIPDLKNRLLMARNNKTLTLLLKNGILEDHEILAFIQNAQQGHFVTVHPQSVKKEKAENFWDSMHLAILNQNDSPGLKGKVSLDISPPTDNRPFFFNLVNFSQAQKGEYGGSSGFIFQHGRALALLLGLLKITVTLAFLFLLVPLWFLPKEKKVSLSWVGQSLYFFGLGFGYLLVEIPILQQLILFLGHPTYSLTVVLFTMLVSSGLGSLIAGEIKEKNRGFITKILIGAILVLILLSQFLPFFIQVTIQFPIAVRILLAMTIIGPIGFLLGIPFPLGLREIQKSDPGFTAWAWAINGAASVAAPVVAMVLAIRFGFAAVFMTGAFAYGLALVSFLMIYGGKWSSPVKANRNL